MYPKQMILKKIFCLLLFIHLHLTKYCSGNRALSEMTVRFAICHSENKHISFKNTISADFLDLRLIKKELSIIYTYISFYLGLHFSLFLINKNIYKKKLSVKKKIIKLSYNYKKSHSENFNSYFVKS